MSSLWRLLSRYRLRYQRELPLILSVFVVGFWLGRYSTSKNHISSSCPVPPPPQNSLKNVRTSDATATTTAASASITNKNDQASPPSTVIFGNVEDIPLRPTSHEGVQKHQLVEPFSVHPNLAGISIGILDQHSGVVGVERHEHESMSEFFYVLEGQGTVTVSTTTADDPNDPSHQQEHHQQHSIQKGSFVYVGPKQGHSFAVSDESETKTKPLKLLLVGLTNDAR